MFMGDCGSLMLGYTLAVILVSLGNGESPIPFVTLAMVITLPLLDTLLVMARRVRHGQSPFRPDRTHLHHRLLDLGLPHPAVVSVIYFVAIFFGAMVIKIYRASGLGAVFQFVCHRLVYFYRGVCFAA